MGRTLGIIPARGGSKRLPRKNVLMFHGRPMIAYTIAAARESGCLDRIVVSTDDSEIAAVAESFGVAVDARPAGLARDEVRVIDVCRHVFARESDKGRNYERFCCLYPAAPLRHAADVRAVVALVEPGHHDFALAVTTYEMPPHQALRLCEDGALSPMWPDLVERRAADIGTLVVDNGSTYATSVSAFLDVGSFYGPGLRGHLMPRERSVDIDHAVDLALAEFHFGRLRECGFSS